MSPTLREFRRRYLPAIAAWDLVGQTADFITWDFKVLKPYDQEKRADAVAPARLMSQGDTP